jgi:hypothetical protein
MKPMRNKWFLALVLALALFGGIRLYYRLTDGFKLSNISDSLPARPEWDFPMTPQIEKELDEAVKQPFTYIGKGAQVYAFASTDGKYVLKFFKFKHLRPSLFITLLPPIGPLKAFKEQNQQRKERKLQGVFDGHAIAYERDRVHSGLIYVHLNLSNNLQKQVTLIDKIGRKHLVDLDSTVFVLQRKGETMRTVLSDLLDKGEVQLAVKRAESILSMYRDEYQNHVYDRDHGISHNTGFIGDKPFHLDVGKFSYDPHLSKEFAEADLAHASRKIREWVSLNYPQYRDQFQLINESQ